MWLDGGGGHLAAAGAGGCGGGTGPAAVVPVPGTSHGQLPLGCLEPGKPGKKGILLWMAEIHFAPY